MKKSTKNPQKRNKKKNPHLIYIRGLEDADCAMLDKLKARKDYTKHNSQNILKAGYELFEVDKENKELKENVKALQKQYAKRFAGFDKEIADFNRKVEEVKREIEDVLAEVMGVSEQFGKLQKRKAAFFKKQKFNKNF